MLHPLHKQGPHHPLFQADSGGVLACKNDTTGAWTQYGIVSYGVNGVCVMTGYPSVFTNVARFAGWIQTGIRELSSLFPTTVTG